MYAPRVFLSMTIVLVVFSAVTYWMTGSIGTVVIQTILSAVILQAGYFVGVLYLVYREKAKRPQERSEHAAGAARSREDVSSEPTVKLKITDR